MNNMRNHFSQFLQISLCLMDAEDYSNYPIAQYEEDNILRELNKCLLSFRQNMSCPLLSNSTNANIPRRSNSTTSSMSGRENRLEHNSSIQRRCVHFIIQTKACVNHKRYYFFFRLSPIGESGRSSPKDVTKIVIKQPSTSTKKSSYDSTNGNFLLK